MLENIIKIGWLFFLLYLNWLFFDNIEGLFRNIKFVKKLYIFVDIIGFVIFILCLFYIIVVSNSF